MKERVGNKLYFKELSGALVLYALVLAAALTWSATLPNGAARTALLLAPMLPFGLAAWAIARQIRRADEFIRLSTLENIAIAAAVTAGWTFTYGFLENAGLPKISMFTVWPVMAAVWGVLACVRAARNR